MKVKKDQAKSWSTSPEEPGESCDVRERTPDPASPASTDTFHSVISQNALGDLDSALITETVSNTKATAAQRRELNQPEDAADSSKPLQEESVLSVGKATSDSATAVPATHVQVRHVQMCLPNVSNIRQFQPISTSALLDTDSRAKRLQPATIASGHTSNPNRTGLGLSLQSQFGTSSASPYPSLKLINRLSNENSCIKLLQKLSPAMQSLSQLSGEELVNFFHNCVSLIGGEDETLSHLVWCTVTPYVNPRQEIVSCVMLSSKALYFVSDDVPKKKGVQVSLLPSK